MTLSKINTQCQVCGDSLLNGDLVICYRCHTPHHEDCWDYVQQCSTFGCNCHQCNKIDVSDIGLDHINSNKNDCMIETNNALVAGDYGIGKSKNQVISIDGKGAAWKDGKLIGPAYHELPDKVVTFDHGNNWIDNPASTSSYGWGWLDVIFGILYILVEVLSAIY